MRPIFLRHPPSRLNLVEGKVISSFFWPSRKKGEIKFGTGKVHTGEDGSNLGGLYLETVYFDRPERRHDVGDARRVVGC